MANELLPKQRQEARRQGMIAVGAWALAGVIFFVKVAFLFKLGAIGVAVYLTQRWFRYRAGWGMRF